MFDLLYAAPLLPITIGLYTLLPAMTPSPQMDVPLESEAEVPSRKPSQQQGEEHEGYHLHPYSYPSFPSALFDFLGGD